MSHRLSAQNPSFRHFQEPPFLARHQARWSSLALVLAIFALRLLPPAAQHWLPPCPFHLWTGLLCPGCGGTRALLALLHGDLHAAWMANALLLLLLPFFGLYGLVACLRHHLPAIPPPVIASLLLATLAFGVIRNLPLS